MHLNIYSMYCVWNILRTKQESYVNVTNYSYLNNILIIQIAFKL